MSDKDIETGNRLMPVYIAITCSKARYDKLEKDFDSNSVASKMNVETFNPCWTDIFFNKNDGLEDRLEIPENDENFIEGIYLVWVIVKKPQTPWGEVDYLTPCLSKTYIGIIQEETLQKYLPKTASELKKQKIHYSLNHWHSRRVVEN